MQSDIGTVAAGKTIDRILLAYDDPSADRGDPVPGLDRRRRRGGARRQPIDGSSLTNYVDTRRGHQRLGLVLARQQPADHARCRTASTSSRPVTNATSNSWEYDYQRSNNTANLPMLQGLAISHEPSPWMGDRNQMSVMPVPAGGPLTGAPSGRALAFSHGDEVARPDFYRVDAAERPDRRDVADRPRRDHAVHLPVRAGHRKPRVLQRHVHHRHGRHVHRLGRQRKRPVGRAQPDVRVRRPSTGRRRRPSRRRPPPSTSSATTSR